MRKKFLTFEKMICQFRSVFDLSKDFVECQGFSNFWGRKFLTAFQREFREK